MNCSAPSAALAYALRSKSAEWDGIVKSGRTHLQDAVPIRLGQEVGAAGRSSATSSTSNTPLKDCDDWVLVVRQMARV